VTKPTRLKLAEAVDLKQVPMTADEKAQMKVRCRPSPPIHSDIQAERINAQTRSLTPQGPHFRHDVISVPFQARMLDAEYGSPARQVGLL